MKMRGLRLAVYARFSSDRQRENSIEDQVRRCKEFVERAGGNPDAVTVFPDYAVSGGSMARPGFEKLMAAVEQKLVDAIITEDISRISRDFADAATIFKKLQYARVPLHGVADGIDTSRKDAKLNFTIKSLLSDMYLDDLRDKTLRGLEGRALAGRATGGVPYGYKTVRLADDSGSAIEIAGEDSKVVERIFDLYRLLV